MQAGWFPAADVDEGSSLHTQYLAATDDLAGITACQVGTAFATRTAHAWLRSLFPPLVWGSDELRRWLIRRRARVSSPPPEARDFDPMRSGAVGRSVSP
jgi:hypothetical protein